MNFLVMDLVHILKLYNHQLLHHHLVKQLQGQEMQEDLQYQKVIMVVKVITHRLLEQLVVVEVLVLLDKMVNLVIMVVMVEQVFQIQ